MRAAPLWAIALSFAPLSLMMFGGANAILPELHRQAVDVQQWMSDAEFATLFAVAQAAPGPNILVVSLLGWQVAGLAGLLIATLAINVPHCILTFGVGHILGGLGHARWLRDVRNALLPVTVGLILGSAVVMGRAADHSALAVGISAGAATFILLTNRNPLWVMVLGTVAALMGTLMGLTS
jgi:chromate transporter